MFIKSMIACPKIMTMDAWKRINSRKKYKKLE